MRVVSLGLPERLSSAANEENVRAAKVGTASSTANC